MVLWWICQFVLTCLKRCDFCMMVRNSNVLGVTKVLELEELLSSEHSDL